MTDKASAKPSEEQPVKVDSTPQLEEDDEFEEFDTEGNAALHMRPVVSVAVASAQCILLFHMPQQRLQGDSCSLLALPCT